MLSAGNIFDLGTPLIPGATPAIDGLPAATVRLSASATMAIQPNPFNPQTTISIEMPAAGFASVRVFDVRGALVKTLRSGTLGAGRHEVRWDGRDNTGRSVASGVYFVQLEAGDVHVTKRAVLLK